ncbi:hypothetical protein, partial [Desulfofundulus sp.]|uniref:hypothetical protein n=1 Tax=Desulfofundulus sp. TaxID=2282750 RepID=UPI003C74F6C7
LKVKCLAQLMLPVETLKERVQKEGIVLYDRQGEENSSLKRLISEINEDLRELIRLPLKPGLY